MSVVKKQRGFPDATLKNLVKRFINGPANTSLEELKTVWVKEFESVEGALAVKRQQEVGYQPAAMKELKKSLRRYTKFLSTLSGSLTSETVKTIYQSLGRDLPNTSLDEQIQDLTKTLSANQAVAQNEVAQMNVIKASFEAATKEYLAARKVAYKTWRNDYSAYLKYLKETTDAEIRKQSAVLEASLMRKANAAERRQFNQDVKFNLENAMHDKIVGRVDILSYFTEVVKREGFTHESAERYSRIFAAHRDIGKIKVSQYRVSNSGTVCARLAEMITEDIVRSVVSSYGEAVVADVAGCSKGPSLANLAAAKLHDHYLPFVLTSPTYKKVKSGGGLELNPERSVLLPHVKKVRKAVCPNIKFTKDMPEIISSIVCDAISSFVVLARSSNEKAKTLSDKSLLYVLRVRFEDQPDALARFSAVVESAYAPKKKRESA
mgnify:CR=1 FL=1